METVNKVWSGVGGEDPADGHVRTLDPKTIGRALTRFCSGKRVEMDEHDGWVPPAIYPPAARPVLAR
jgi:hypothetical protein